jgi:hypothetical protein
MSGSKAARPSSISSETLPLPQSDIATKSQKIPTTSIFCSSVQKHTRLLCSTDRPSLARICTEPASIKRMPTGFHAAIACETAVTSAFALSRVAFDCKVDLHKRLPVMVDDSMCSMLSISVVRTRSHTVAMHPSISCALSPVYCQATAMTGMPILGKMPVRVSENHHGREHQDEQRDRY